MTDIVKVALIAATPSTVLALLNYFHQVKVDRKADEIRKKTEEIHKTLEEKLKP